MKWLSKYKDNRAKAQDGKTIGNLNLEQTTDIEKQREWLNDWNKNRKIKNTSVGVKNTIPYSSDIYVDQLNPPNQTKKPFTNYGEFDSISNRIILDENYNNKEGVPTHEFAHRFQKDLRNSNLPVYEEYINTPIKTKLQGKPQTSEYLSDPEEIHSELMRMRYNNKYKPTEVVNEAQLLNLEDYNLKQFSPEEITDLLNTTASNDTAYKSINQARNGKIIKDNKGQWSHPGQVTKINSNNITMKNVNQKLLGVSDTGDMQLMFPEQEYKFIGKDVTEFPISKNGKSISRKWLDNY